MPDEITREIRERITIKGRRGEGRGWVLFFCTSPRCYDMSTLSSEIQFSSEDFFVLNYFNIIELKHLLLFRENIRARTSFDFNYSK